LSLIKIYTKKILIYIIIILLTSLFYRLKLFFILEFIQKKKKYLFIYNNYEYIFIFNYSNYSNIKFNYNIFFIIYILFNLFTYFLSSSMIFLLIMLRFNYFKIGLTSQLFNYTADHIQLGILLFFYYNLS